MTIQDQVLTALTAWRENRQSGVPGLQSIVNVIMNRAAKTGDSPYAVCTTHDQFTSINPPSTLTVAQTETGTWPVEADPQWQQALSLASQAAAGTLADITHGSTLYYAPYAIQSTATIILPSGQTVPFPKGWNADMVEYCVSVGGQLFFSEN
jgi:hypothetical protein